MSEYPKIIERPYKVFTGEPEYEYGFQQELVRTGVSWTYQRSFRLGSSAETYAEKMSESYELVKIEVVDGRE